MPVRFIVAPHPAAPVATFKSLQKPQDCLDSTWGRKSTGSCAELLQSSLQAPAHWSPAQSFNAAVSAPTLTEPAGVAHDGNSTATTAQYLPSLPQQSAAWDLSQLRPRSNGFVDTVVEAYNKHHPHY
ncbi:hypothetical protein D9619_008694 [Psilocybe cf. subviscida]|uniref:Uncharacterized protein n=1 Tax=Psilocybe cf. subviscida TaxID=2480587 RepID=A0A8H5B9W0_9AGAR|nr:hypothetical protein D9619_008694 [Psilocybe cf. subviscida]